MKSDTAMHLEKRSAAKRLLGAFILFADGRQVASTVANSCRLTKPAKTVSVVAVDRWGNVGKGQP